MEKRTLEIHTFELKDSKNPKIHISLSNIQGKDIFEELKGSFIPFVDQLPPSRMQGKTCKIPKNDTSQPVFSFSKPNRYICGKINIGEDNDKQQSVVDNTKDKNELYVKHKGESIERPFFYLLVLPENQTTGFLVLEREGRNAMKGVFCDIVKRFVTENLFGLTVDFKAFVEDAFIRNILEHGELNQIILSRKDLPEGACESYFGSYKEKGKYNVQLSIVPQGETKISNRERNKILKQLNTHTSFFENKELHDLGFDENASLKVVTTYNGSTRTIDLRETFKVRPYYRVYVLIDATGFSDFKSITNKAVELLKSFSLEILP